MEHSFAHLLCLVYHLLLFPDMIGSRNPTGPDHCAVTDSPHICFPCVISWDVAHPLVQICATVVGIDPAPIPHTAVCH